MKNGIAAALYLLMPLGAQAPADPLLRWMDRIAQRQLDEREKEIAKVRTVADAERRKKIVRAKMLDALGGLPDYHGPLNARVTGSIQADGYVIEKVLYESLPGYFVTANLYRPSRPGRYPAVLLQAGHTQEGKAEPQRVAANLALKDFIALAFDPSGQGEREQTYDPQLKAPAAGWSVNEHIHGGNQSALAGEGVGRYFIFDAMRSIDYLVSRPDVDSSRLGAAGCSGGGALTLFTGALDARLKAVIPSCFPGSYRLLFSGADPHSEMTLPQHLFRGLDSADFVELAAPAPWQLHATEKDFFIPAGAKLVYEEARRWYGLYRAEDKLDYFVGPGTHGTPLSSREAMYRWFIRWLKDGKGDWHEQPVRTYTNHELLVTKTGRVEDLPGSRKLYQVILESYVGKRRPGTIDGLRAELKKKGIFTDRSAPAMKVVSETDGAARRIRFESEPGIELEGTLYTPATPGRHAAVLLLPGRLTEMLARSAVQAGRVALTFEPRHSEKLEARWPFVGDWQANTRADQIGISLAAVRARDILRAVDLLAARPDVDAGDIRAAGEGVKSIWLLMAAAADARLHKIWLERTPHTFQEALHNTLNTNLSDAIIPGFALHWDLEDLVKAMGERPLMRTDPTNWMGIPEYAGPRFQYRWVLGDLTEMKDAQDLEYVRQFLN